MSVSTAGFVTIIFGFFLYSYDLADPQIWDSIREGVDGDWVNKASIFGSVPCMITALISAFKLEDLESENDEASDDANRKKHKGKKHKGKQRTRRKKPKNPGKESERQKEERRRRQKEERQRRKQLAPFTIGESVKLPSGVTNHFAWCKIISCDRSDKGEFNPKLVRWEVQPETGPDKGDLIWYSNDDLIKYKLKYGGRRRLAEVHPLQRVWEPPRNVEGSRVTRRLYEAEEAHGF